MGEGEKKVIKEIQYEKKKYRPKCGHIAHSSGVYVTSASIPQRLIDLIQKVIVTLLTAKQHQAPNYVWYCTQCCMTNTTGTWSLTYTVQKI